MARTGSDIEVTPLPTDTEYEYEDYGEEETIGEMEEEPYVYHTEDFISGPYLSDDCTVPDEILEFDHSFGYDCKKYFNLVAADEDTVIFATGNLITFFNIKTNTLWFRRSALGGGIGCLAKNPSPEYNYIAVAENGHKPPIVMYEWPSLEIVCVLKGGSAKCFTHMNFSPDGQLLASQGGEPDFLITIWNWPKSKILLRTKSYVNDVYKVMFSPEVPGQLTTCGLAHIKFWKMAQTFTGLKLQGELGRFGKTEYSDILGVYPMPDEKVISGCFWGNFLVWDGGLIKFEVCRKLRKKCHEAPIVQFDYINGELWTIGMDGRIRVWYYDTIDQADPPDDDRVVQVEPTYDFYHPTIMFMCVCKQFAHDPKDTYYFAQDGNGGIWRIDLTTDTQPKPAQQLYKCHAGAVMDIAACPWDDYLASLGIDGRLHIYNYIKKELIFTHQFPAKGACMIWLPLNHERTGCELFLGFDDGQVRVAMLMFEEDHVKLILIQVIKPHKLAITRMSTNETGTLLVTGGEDCTIFICAMQQRDFVRLVPIGYISVPSIVTCLSWLPTDDNNCIIVGCMLGHVVQVDLPTEPQDYTTTTYRLKLNPKEQQFTTYKAQIRRDIKIRQIEAKKAIKLAKKMEEMERIIKENPGLEIDEEVFLADSDEEEELEPLFIPEVPNRVIWLQSTEEATLWLSMGGYDAGYVYEYDIDQMQDIPTRFQIIFDGDDIEINYCLYNSNKKYIIFAMQDGAIRFNKVNPNDWRDFSDYWELHMHDNYNGVITKMCFNHDERYFFTCGQDGNIFSYKYNPEQKDNIRNLAKRAIILKAPIGIPDVTEGYKIYSLEETIVNAESDRKQKLANHRKRLLLEKLAGLQKRFSDMLVRNNKLLPTQVISREELEIDPRITDDLQYRLDADLDLVKRKLAFRVEKSEVGMKKLLAHFIDPLETLVVGVTALTRNVRVHTLRQRKLTPIFHYMLGIVDKKILEAELKGRPPERPPIVVEIPPPPEKKEKQLEYFLLGLSHSTIQFKLGAKLHRLLSRYRARKAKLEKRQQEWDEFNARKPAEGVNHPDDEAALAQAEETIGDYKLKSAPDYKVPKHLRESTVKKYKQLLNIRQLQYDIRNRYDKKVLELRDRKVRLREYIMTLNNALEQVHKEIPKNLQKSGPATPELSDSDFPEKNLEVVVTPVETEPTKNRRSMSLEEEKIKPVPVIVEPSHGDSLELEILGYKSMNDLEGTPEDILNAMLVPDIVKFTNTPVSEAMEIANNEEVDTPWESELRTLRLVRKLFEQDYIIKKIETAIDNFDNEVQDMFYERIQVLVDAYYTDLHLLTLHQELIILKDFEAFEDFLTEKVNNRITEVLDMQDLMIELNNKVEVHKREIERLQDREKEITQQFFNAVTDNKFYDFLRRIYRKKYKPPKVHTDDDESDSSSSSSSEESEEDADAGSIDSRDIGPIRLDENICPKGCDQALYDFTFLLRNQRHGVELDIKEQYRLIELLKKDLEIKGKKIKIIESNLKVSQEELEAYQREKQRKLNEVMCTVVVKLDQLQNLQSENQMNRIADSLIFSKTTLSKLYKRVGQLSTETLQQKAKHKINMTHLCRMKTDCKHMEKTIADLKAEIVERMLIKFGREIDIDELEEALLRRMVFDLRMSMLDIKSLYEHELILWRNKYAEKQTELAQTIKDNTVRRELIAMMSHEKADLARIVSLQDKKREHLDVIVSFSEASKEEIKKLSDVVKSQRKHIQDLKDEIQMLSLKGMPPKPIRERSVTRKHAEEEIEERVHDYRADSPVPDYDQLGQEEEFKYNAVQLPLAVSKSSEELAKSIIHEMLEAVDSDWRPTREFVAQIVEEILRDTMNRSSVAQIIDDLLAVLPFEPTDDQQCVIELTAEKLYSLQEPEVNEDDIRRCACEVLEEILKEVVTGSPEDVIARLISELLQQLPMDFILQEDSMELITQKVAEHLSDSNINKEQLAESVLSSVPFQQEEVKLVLNQILETVFGAGIDFLYYIKHQK